MIRVYFAGGGSGGHLFPGIAVAEELRELRPDVEVSFLCRPDRVEQERVRKAGFQAVPIRTGRLSRSPARMLWTAASLVWGTFAALRRMRRERPAFVVGLGGYASGPAVLAARWSGARVLFLELNAIPGKVNRWFAPKAEAFFVPWPQCTANLPPGTRPVCLGNPIRRSIAQAKRTPLDEAWWGDRAQRMTLLVLGGSQGSLFLNDLMIEIAPRLGKLPAPFRIIHVSGPSRQAELETAYRVNEIPAEVSEFRSDMDQVYAQSDLAICRGGGSTLAELTAMGLPAIVIPHPHAENHQLRNAEVLQEAGAAFCIPQGPDTGRRTLERLEQILSSRDVYLTMEKSARALGKPDAARNIAEWISQRLPR